MLAGRFAFGIVKWSVAHLGPKTVDGRRGSGCGGGRRTRSYEAGGAGRRDPVSTQKGTLRADLSPANRLRGVVIAGDSSRAQLGRLWSSSGTTRPRRSCRCGLPIAGSSRRGPRRAGELPEPSSSAALLGVGAWEETEPPGEYRSPEGARRARSPGPAFLESSREIFTAELLTRTYGRSRAQVEGNRVRN
jgi:hypothetical protein